MPTIIPLSTSIFTTRLAVPLPRYAQIVEYYEPAFFGVSNPDIAIYGVAKDFQCREIWSHDQRVAAFRALQNAQSKMESVTEYPMMPTWIGPERHTLGNPQVLNVGKLIQMGQLLVIDLGLGAAVDITSDPAVITIALGGFPTFATGDIPDVHIYHPGTDLEIYPSSIEIVGTDLVIEIPFVRAVEIAHENTPADGLDYADHATWVEDTVDVKWESLGTAAPVKFVSLDCSGGCTCPTESLVDGCAYVRNAEMGIIHVSTNGCSCLACDTAYVDIYYQAGVTQIDAQAEDIMVRLAHALMPNEPCGCDILKGRWRGDQLVPEVLTAERENAPWGMSNGAWQAWVYAQSIKQHRMGVL